jgi:hypothetical protein
MQKFLIENWSKLMVNSSVMMVSFGFMIYAIGSVTANDSSINDLNNKPRLRIRNYKREFKHFGIVP